MDLSKPATKLSVHPQSAPEKNAKPAPLERFPHETQWCASLWLQLFWADLTTTKTRFRSPLLKFFLHFFKPTCLSLALLAHFWPRFAFVLFFVLRQRVWDVKTNAWDDASPRCPRRQRKRTLLFFPYCHFSKQMLHLSQVRFAFLTFPTMHLSSLPFVF